MQGVMYDHIHNLNNSRTNWKIKVRCTRFWPTFSPETNVVRGYNFILLDDDNSHIHAYVYPDNWNAIGTEVVEGKIYVFENFQVRDTFGRLKPVSNKLCIRLLSSTIIVEQPNDIMIPLHKFEFMDLGDLVEESNKVVGDQNPEFAIDIIGAIEDFNKSKKIPTRIGERDVVRFKITDGSFAHKVTVWGDLAAIVSNDYKHALEKPVIGIVTSAKISLFRGDIQLGTLPSTRIYFNLDVETVNDFRNRLIEEGYKSPDGAAIVVSNNAPSINFISFASIVGGTATLSSQDSYVVTFTISKIEEEDNWWFHSCTVCHEEVQKVDRKFKCDKCHCSFPYSEKRFRVSVLAEDNSHACNVILMDRIVKRMIGTTVTNMLNDMKKTSSSTVVAEMYAKITGKEISAKIQVSEGNINGDSNIYEAADLFDLASFQSSDSYQKSPESGSSLFSQSMNVHGIELFQTPGSAKSVSKKIKKEDEIVEVIT